VILKNGNFITSDMNFMNWFLNCISHTCTHCQQTVHINGLQTSLVPVCVLLAVCSQTVYKQMFPISCLLWEMENKIQYANTSSVHCALLLRQMLRMWTRENTLRLIEDLHSLPCLWDVQTAEYKNSNKKSDAHDTS
jgi:hypothetical protein